MRIIQANKYWYLRGGAERYAFELTKLLEKAGHEIAPFAMRGPKNEPTPYERFFVSPVATDALDYGGEGLRTAGRMLWSFEAARNFGALCGAFRPEVLHAHNLYHQLSPSVIAEARKRGLPTVMTIHDYHLISPDYLLFDGTRAYDPSVKHPYLDAARRRAVRGSLLASAWSGFKSWAHRAMKVYDHVSTFIAPSEFAKRKHVEYGWPDVKIEVVPHFIDLAGRSVHLDSKPRVVFVGRLSPEKGAHVLVRAMRRVPEVECVIVGDGPERARLHILVEDLQLKNVRFAGRLDGKALESEVAAARAVVVPSLVYETFGLSVLEAYALGKPVIASQLGGLPEVVRDGETGLLFAAGDEEQLAADIKELMDVEKARRFGLAGRKLAETDYAPEKHLERVLAIYARAKGA